MTQHVFLHASAVYWQGCGILMTGPSGTGKSDLALRLLYEKQAQLVTDDGCELFIEKEQPFMRAAGTLAGYLEVRGMGVIQVPPSAQISSCALTFVLDLKPYEQISRLPESELFKPFEVPVYALDPFEVSALAKISALVDVHHQRASFYPQDLLLDSPKQAAQHL